MSRGLHFGNVIFLGSDFFSLGLGFVFLSQCVLLLGCKLQVDNGLQLLAASVTAPELKDNLWKEQSLGPSAGVKSDKPRLGQAEDEILHYWAGTEPPLISQE